MGKSKMKLSMKCTIDDGWGYVELNKRAVWDLQNLIAQHIADISKTAYAMGQINRLSRMYMELDKTDKLEMLSREDMLALSMCIPTEIEHVFNPFHRANWFKNDDSKFTEANHLLKSMYSIHTD